MRKLIFRIHMLSMATFCGLILALASCASEDIVQNGMHKNNTGQAMDGKVLILGSQF